MNTYIQDKIKEDIYRLMDSFLTESKDQNGKERSIDTLNYDRHLFVQNMETVISTALTGQEERHKGEIEEIYKDIKGIEHTGDCEDSGCNFRWNDAIHDILYILDKYRK